MGSSEDTPVATPKQGDDAGVPTQPQPCQNPTESVNDKVSNIDDREPLGGYIIPDEDLTFDEDGLPLITDADLETTSRVLQLFYRFPEVAVGARFTKYSKEYHLRQNVRINAMRWLKPGNIPSVKTILKSKHSTELEVLHSSGIRQGRNRKKKMLPQQLGQVFIEMDSNGEFIEGPSSNETQLLENQMGDDQQDADMTDDVPTSKPSKFQPVQRKDLSDNFRVHPSVDAMPLSGASQTSAKAINPLHDPNFKPEVSQPKSRTSSSSSAMVVEVIDDDQDQEAESDPTPKRSKLSNLNEFTRNKHVDNFDESNPQPKEHHLMPDASTYTPKAVANINNRVIIDDLDSSDLKIDPTTASDFLKVDIPVGLQSAEQTANIAQRYARSFTGSSVPLKQGSANVSVAPSATVVEIETVSDDESTPVSADGMSRNNKVIKKGKQENQKWSSKEGLYGGSLKIDEEEAMDQTNFSEQQLPEMNTDGRPRALQKSIPCYVCKVHFKVLHHFYDRLCPTCAEFNYKKRFQTADMVIRRRDPVTGQVTCIPRVCLVTGARVKIGYEIALKLLRAGAFVIATSRFSNDTAIRFAKEDDFESWKDRLHIYALDFRVISAVEMFANFILKKYPRLDMIMNNAAQTIRRPPQFYRHLLDNERIAHESLPTDIQNICQDFISPEFRKASASVTAAMLENFNIESKSALALSFDPTKKDASESESEAETTGKKDDGSSSRALQNYDDAGSMSTRMVTLLSMPSAAAINPAELTQLPLVAGDESKADDARIFPVGMLDKDDQQIDLRDKQTWVLQADEVSTVELAEVQLVNSMAPFILNTKLKPLLRRSGSPTWIINVSSMEGKFRGFKDTTHPHTNMAKAALNMFTHTSAKDYAHDRIFMNAVDTGWVTEELPHAIAVHKASIGFAPPLDENDGASRCLDPVFTSLLTGVYEFGKFFKDYGEGHW